MNPGTGGGAFKFLYGDAPPVGATAYPFVYHFDRKRYPFHISLIEKRSPALYYELIAINRFHVERGAPGGAL